MPLDFNPPSGLDPTKWFGDAGGWSPDAIVTFFDKNPWILIIIVIFAVFVWYFIKELQNARNRY